MERRFSVVRVDRTGSRAVMTEEAEELAKVNAELVGVDCATEDEIIEAAKRTGARVAGPMPLPTRIERYCVNRSPHADKKSMEQFEVRTHKRLLDVINPTAKTVDELKKLNLPAGVDIAIKI